VKVRLTKHAVERLRDRFGMKLKDLLKLEGSPCILCKYRNNWYLFVGSVCFVGVIESNEFIAKSCIYPFMTGAYKMILKGYGKREIFKLDGEPKSLAKKL